MFDRDFASDLPSGNDLLAELGLSPASIADILDEDRVMRCPDRDTAMPSRPSAGLAGQSPFGRIVREPVPADVFTLDAAPAGRGE